MFVRPNGIAPCPRNFSIAVALWARDSRQKFEAPVQCGLQRSSDPLLRSGSRPSGAHVGLFGLRHAVARSHARYTPSRHPTALIRSSSASSVALAKFRFAGDIPELR